MCIYELIREIIDQTATHILSEVNEVLENSKIPEWTQDVDTFSYNLAIDNAQSVVNKLK